MNLMNHKRLTALCLAASMTLLAGCGASGGTSAETDAEENKGVAVQV